MALQCLLQLNIRKYLVIRMLRNTSGIVTIWIAFVDRGEFDIASYLSRIFDILQVVPCFY